MGGWRGFSLFLKSKAYVSAFALNNILAVLVISGISVCFGKNFAVWDMR